MPVEAMMCVEFRQRRLRGSKFSPSPARSVGEGARRADEGSFFKPNRYVRFILLQKSSSPECRQTGRALTRPSATLSHCFATGEGENCRGPADCSNFSPDSPAQAGKGENDRMAVRCGKLSTPHRPC